MVGISTRTPEAARDLLAEEGFPIEIADSGPFGAYVDIASTSFDEADLLAQVERSAGPLVRLARWPNGARSALAVSGDIDSITLQDFALRVWEKRR